MSIAINESTTNKKYVYRLGTHGENNLSTPVISVWYNNILVKSCLNIVFITKLYYSFCIFVIYVGDLAQS